MENTHNATLRAIYEDQQKEVMEKIQSNKALQMLLEGNRHEHMEIVKEIVDKLQKEQVEYMTKIETIVSGQGKIIEGM
jgi:hypothetical protein